MRRKILKAFLLVCILAPGLINLTGARLFAQQKPAGEIVVDLVVEAERDGEVWNYRTQAFGDISGKC